jgi:hypothetical protein
MTTTDRHPAMSVQLAVHGAVRRDLARLGEALTDGRAPADAVRTYWAQTAEQLHHHHEFEDTVVWPSMAERLGAPVAELLARNRQEHVTMAEAMDDLDAVVASTSIDPVAAREALGRLEAAVDTHLSHEEADVLPFMSEAFTMEDVAHFQAESAKTNPGPAFLPWVLDAAPDDIVAFFTGAMPAPVRSQLEAEWQPRRLAVVEALRAGAAAAPVG